MLTIKINRYHVSKKILNEAAAALSRGAVIVYPTDTAYGLGADPMNTKAVQKIFAIKGRSKEKKSPLIAGSMGQAADAVRLAGKVLKLAKKYWPGPLTIVTAIRKKNMNPAVRVPWSLWARALALAFGRPITSTSANISGRSAIYRSGEIRRAFAKRKQKPDIFLDAGDLPVRKPSTILRVVNGKIKILREGPIIPSPRRRDFSRANIGRTKVRPPMQM